MSKHIIEEIRAEAMPIHRPEDYIPLLEQAGKGRFVLMGEATHGTEEFYRIRAELSKLLILHYGFTAIAVEADWPDAYRINRYVRGEDRIANVYSALSDFKRFPTWMWRNTVMVDFVAWLHQYNRSESLPEQRIGFYGLDFYSLHASIEAVIAYLETQDIHAAERARRYYGCFGQYTENPSSYGYANLLGLTASCEKAAVAQLISLREHAFEYMKHNGFQREEDYFCAEQNAKVVVGAEEYYRTMLQGRISSWNLRDRHMVDTLNNLAAHLSDWQGRPAKIIVWAHNSHIGDARATEMGEQGEWNIGQLVREHYGHEAMLIGFSTYEGEVTAASEWDGDTERKRVLPGIKESYEELFHKVGLARFLLFPRANPVLEKHLHLSRLQRAIGVLYLPATERQSHYFFTRLPEQFDAVIHIDHTQALKPLDITPLWHKGEAFETYPSGL